MDSACVEKQRFPNKVLVSSFPSENLSRPGVDTGDHGVVSLERLKGELLLGLDALLPKLGDLTGEDGFGGGG